jgi:hypothetical protein
LFNFLNRQALRLTDQYDRTVRHLKVAAVWGVQILLYPVYLIAQAGLSIGRQLSSAAEAGWPQLKAFTDSQPEETPLAADTPIQQVLSQVNALEFQVEWLNVGRLNVENSAQSRTCQLSNLPYPTPPENDPRTETATLNGHTYGEQPSTSSNHQLATSAQLTETTQESSNQRYAIQGVATLLATRSLVLVTVENHILDILTPQQQQKLSSKISWEVANLRRQWRIAQASGRQFTQRPLTTLDKPRLFLPARLFWQLMGWVQTSPVAIAANLFQESTLIYRDAPSPSQILSLRHSPPLMPRLSESNDGTIIYQQAPQSAISAVPTPRAIAFLDRTVADLESHQLVPGSEVVIALRERTQKLLHPLQSKFITPRHQSGTSEAYQRDKFRIQALIYAAIDYFFGRHRSNWPQTPSQERLSILANSQGEVQQLSGRHSTALPPNLEFTDADEPDPWLTWSDLYGPPDPLGRPQNQTFPDQGGESKIQNPNSPAQLPATFTGKISARSGNSIWNVVKRYLSRNQPPGKLSVPYSVQPRVEVPESDVPIAKLKNQARQRDSVSKTLKNQGRQRGTAPTKHKTLSRVTADSRRTSISPATAGSGAITTPSSPSPDAPIEAAPDWIETQATPTGYVKHPLEQLLEWLDFAMLWLEELVLKVWRWVQNRRRRG